MPPVRLLTLPLYKMCLSLWFILFLVAGCEAEPAEVLGADDQTAVPHQPVEIPTRISATALPETIATPTTAVLPPTSTTIPTATLPPTQVATSTKPANATACVPPPDLLETEVDIVADPFCIVWIDEFTDETGFQVILEYPQSGEQFIYETAANVTQLIVPENDTPRLTESLEQCMRRNAFMVQVIALMPATKRNVGGTGANIECGGPGSQPLPTATATP